MVLGTDNLKVDFGVHVKGQICDSALTLTFDGGQHWDPLLSAVRDATNGVQFETLQMKVSRRQ